MTYQDALSYIESTLLFGSKPGLERIGGLLELMGNPQDSLCFVHVAGTNGKGSTASAIASVLTKAGIKTGLYTSPYISDFCERIRIDGEKILHSDLAAEVESTARYVKKFSESAEQPTEFEIITALAFDYFKKKSCKVVVLEVGLGGRFDATNIIKRPLLSVITSISLDHTAILGDTTAKIAAEKCGIIKDGGTTVSSPEQDSDALEVIMKTCAQRGNTCIIPNLSAVKVLGEGIDGTDILYGNARLHIPLCGRHQIKNFITAYEALTALRRQGYPISDADIEKGFSEVRFIARMEILSRSPLVILDGAHNPSGAAALADSIKRFLSEKPVLIMGMLKDKDFETAISTLAPLSKAFIAIKPDSPRALEPELCAKTASKYCSSVFASHDYTDAFNRAISLSCGAPIIICGSLYLAGGCAAAVRERLHRRQFAD